ncbi:MAG: hypothetical protein WBO35_01215 [Candidatus Saccharimonadales bacterium]
MPELIVVMMLTVFFTGMVMSFAFDYWGQAGVLQNSSDTLVSRQNLGDSIRNRLNVASTLLNQNSIPDPHAMASDPSDLSGTHWISMHAVPEKIMTPASGQITPVLYYAAPVINASKQFVMRGANPYQNEFLLYIDGTKKALMLRSLANNESGASGNTLRTSCPSSAASASCPSDGVLSEDVYAISKRFFSKSGNPIDWNAVKDPETGQPIGPDYPDVEVVELTVFLKKRATIKGTADSISHTTIRVALRNG